jgi:maltooligosyltrehalose trehalohydrolase
VHLILENEANCATLLESDFDAQWNDDFHSVLHVLLTGETQSYYGGFAENPTGRLARCLADGFIYQGETPPGHGARPRGQPSGHLRTTAFVAFLQNHDQVGNRAFGERLIRLARPGALRAAMALLLLGPQIPLLFMGEEVGAREPFLFFTDFHGDLAEAVREGRRKEFGFDAAARKSIPDPNAESTFTDSIWTDTAPDADAWRGLVGDLLNLRHRWIIPRLKGARSIGAAAVGPAAVRASWRMADNAVLTLAVNLGTEAAEIDLPATPPLFGTPTDPGRLAPETTLAWLEP